jgi:uncharacterized protein YecT (DUF1311 family)
MVKRILTTALIVACFPSLKAYPWRQSLRETPCGKYGTQAEANACARRDYEKAEAEMKRVYEQLITELDGRAGERGRKLEKAQSLWVQYREATCESEASIYEGGSIRPAIYNGCLASVTRERSGRLRGFLDETRP